MDAAELMHVADNAVGALSDAMSTLQFCERRIFAALDDHAVKDSTERDLISIAHTLATATRLIEWEIAELEKIAASSEKHVQEAERRARLRGIKAMGRA